jgi:hypothetical protein
MTNSEEEQKKKQEEQQKAPEKQPEKVKKPRSPAQIESYKRAAAARAANVAKRKGEAVKANVNIEKPASENTPKKTGESPIRNAPKPKKKFEIKLGRYRFL